MKAITLCLFSLLLSPSLPSFAVEKKPSLKPPAASAPQKRVYRERVEAEDMQYEVIVDADGNTVDVVPLTEKARGGASPEFELYSGEEEKQRQSAPVALQTIEAPDAGGTRYAGKLDRWNDNYIGFVLTLRNGGGDGKPREIRREFPRAGKAEVLSR